MASRLALLLLWGLGLTCASAATITWTGAVSSDWNNRTNWNPQQVPTSADTAVINSGTVTVAAAPPFSALTFNSGTLTGPIVVGNSCVMNWNGGRLAQGSSLTVQASGAVNLAGSTEKDLACPMTNFGQVVLSGSAFYILNNNSAYQGWVTNAGLWAIQGDVNLASYYGNGYGLFANSGILRKTAGTGISAIGVSLTNGPAGTVDVQSGTLRCDGGAQLDGTFIAAASTVMAFNGGTFLYVPANRYAGSGQYQLTGGTLQGLDDYVPNLQLLGGTVVLSPTYQTNGAIVRLDLNGATLGGRATGWWACSMRSTAASPACWTLPPTAW